MGSPSLYEVTAWENLLSAFRSAARGKRKKASVAGFEHQVADRLLALQAALRDGSWQPGPYVHFKIHSPKTRLISAAPFADRVVHHALCNVVVPLFEPGFDEDSYANRTGKGTHRAVDRFQELVQRHQYALRLDIVRHFPSIDHEVLVGILARRLMDPGEAKLRAAGSLVEQHDRDFTTARRKGQPWSGEAGPSSAR